MSLIGRGVLTDADFVILFQAFLNALGVESCFVLSGAC